MASRLSQYGACFLLVQLMLGCSPEPAAQNQATQALDLSNASTDARTPQADSKLVVAFGDSLYAGYNLGASEGFPSALERALATRGLKAQVVNAGVSGDTSAAGLARLAFTLDGQPRKPDLVIVGLGGNDMLRGLAPEETRANLDKILAELKARGIPAMLTGMVAAPNMGRDYADAFNPIYPDLARKYDVPLYAFFLDGVIGQRQLMLADGIHPNAQGVAKVAGSVAPLVAEALKGG